MRVRYMDGDYYGAMVEILVEDLPRRSCSEAEGYGAGQLERLAQRQERLEEIVGRMLERMARDPQMTGEELLQLAGIRFAATPGAQLASVEG